MASRWCRSPSSGEYFDKECDMKISNRHFHTIALIGLDGSGKSTQTMLLNEALTKQGARVVQIHPFGRKLLSVIPHRVILGSSSTGRRATSPRLLIRMAAIAEILDIGLYVWAAYIWCVLLRLFGHRDVWLVSDRSFDDILVKHRRLQSLSPRLLEHVRSLVPHAGVTIWLHTEPSIARARDNDFDSAYYEELHAAYSAVATRFGWRIIPTSDQTREAVFAHITEELGPYALYTDLEGSRDNLDAPIP